MNIFMVIDLYNRLLRGELRISVDNTYLEIVQTELQDTIYSIFEVSNCNPIVYR